MHLDQGRRISTKDDVHHRRLRIHDDRHISCQLVFGVGRTMKVSREQAAENRERIVQVGSKLFRERGFDGIGVSDLMKAAGLTHGGFYGHFASKEDLAAEASDRALKDIQQYWSGVVDKNPDEAFST